MADGLRSEKEFTLDALLQQALEDFDKPDLLPTENIRTTAKLTSNHGDQEERPSKDSSSDKQHPGLGRENLKSSSSVDEEFFKETALEIDSVLSSIENEDPDLAKQLRNLTDYATKVSSSDEASAMKNFSQFASMFKQTLETVSSHAGLRPEEIVDDDLSDIMENLDKLATNDAGSPMSFPSAEELSSLSQPLNDVVKALLAKDVMLSSLQKCREEYDVWLRANRGKLPGQERTRYESQLRTVVALIAEYESHPDIPDNESSKPANARHYQRLIALIADLQELGEFPDELMTKVDTEAFTTGLPKRRTTTKKELDDLDVPECKTT